MYKLPETINDDVNYFGNLIAEFIEGKIEPIKFKAIRVPMGIYEQRKDGTFMVRIRCSGGFITPEQLKYVTEIAYNHGSELIHITTRQEIQIQNLQIQDTYSILQNLLKVGLTTKGGGGNTVRNILVSVNSGVDFDEVFDVSTYAFDLTTKLIAESDSYTLPRKLKISFSNSEDDSSLAKFNDLGFIPRIRDGKRGFGVFLGGSVASKPMVGYELFEFAPEEDLFYIAEATKTLFSQHGNRKNKHKARLRHLFYKLGKEEVFRLYFEYYNKIKEGGNQIYQPNIYTFILKKPSFKPIIDDSIEFLTWKNRYVAPQKQDGLTTILIPFEHGNANYAALGQIADFANEFGNDVIRFSVRQNLHLRNIPVTYLPNLYQLLLTQQIETETPALINTLVSCTGADTCRLGICLSKGATKALKTKLQKSNLQLDKLSDLRINISGCPNSCGQQIAADIGFFGKVGRNDRMYPAYHVAVGAKLGQDAKLADVVGEISAYDLPQFTEDLLELYLTNIDKNLIFSDYIESEGKTKIIALLNKYKDIPSFSADKNYYFDWGADDVFSLAARGVGECSAGLFDMIEVDLATIQKSTQKLDTATNPTYGNQLLFDILYSSSRMLLITRGEEPKTTYDIFDSFSKKFIDSQLISDKYREVVELGRDKPTGDFLPQKETILNLASDVIALYEAMDDSLQFKNIKTSVDKVKATEPLHSIITKSKDFRGVACPMNFVKTKVELATIQSGDKLEVWLDDGAPIQNVPGSLRNEGHKVISETKIGDYWSVVVEKA